MHVCTSGVFRGVCLSGYCVVMFLVNESQQLVSLQRGAWEEDEQPGSEEGGSAYQPFTKKVMALNSQYVLLLFFLKTTNNNITTIIIIIFPQISFTLL